MGGGKNVSCGMFEAFIFTAALIGGTACSLSSKTMLGLSGEGMTGETEAFSKPIFQTFGMFLGMVTGLLMHVVVKAFHIPFPGYVHSETSSSDSVPMWMYFLLIIPSVFDLLATALCMLGLRDVNVSVYQMLRGSAIVFVAILKHFALGDKLRKFMWVGGGWNVVSIILVGLVAILTASDSETTESSSAVRGVTLILAGAFVQSLQYAFEEKVMTADVAAPPLLLIGMEGLWGTLLCLFIVYPIAYLTPGDDHGSYENPENTWYMFTHSSEIQKIFFIYFLSILSYNVLAVLVTYTLNSVWHAILDNFRPITVWCSDLFMYYIITKAYGEEWTNWSYVQLLGLVVLLYGTAVYNAPNSGSLELRGGFWSMGLDFSYEYEEMSATLAEMEF
ncbi:unnamed protein product, partial [Ectocarpus fasciculatus]